MKKFTNARIYRQHDEASEILVDKGVIKQIGKTLPSADEEIDLRGRLVVPPYVDQRPGDDRRDRHSLDRKPHLLLRLGRRGLRVPHDGAVPEAHTMSFDELDRCLDLITYNGVRTLNVEDQYGIDEGKPANFLVLDADTPFEAVRQRTGVLASIRHGEYLFKRPEPSYEIGLDLFRKTR